MEQQRMALTSKPQHNQGALVAAESFSRISCQHRKLSMLVLRDPSAVRQISDMGIRSLVQERFAQIAAGEHYDWQRHGYMIVLEPGDTATRLEQESGCPVLHDVFDQMIFGDPDFQPAAEILEEHADCYEMAFVLNDDGFAIAIFVPKAEGIDEELLSMCAMFATPARQEVPRLLEPPAKYRVN